MENKRTIQQNKALHLYFTHLSEALNNEGLDMRVVLKPEISIDWTPEMIKEHLWKPIQKLKFSKKSTTELNKNNEITEIWEVLNRFISEKFGIYCPFPSEDELIKEAEEIGENSG